MSNDIMISKNLNEIPVVFTPDENFMVQTAVSILSMLQSKRNDTIYHFYILVSEDINRDSLEYIERIKNIYSDFQYEVTYFDSKAIDGIKVNTAHVTSSTFYRLLLSKIYDFDKCMYHDGDILVNDDLSDMYNIDMGDSYIASVKAIGQQQDGGIANDLINTWGFKSLEQYVFAGDLTMNLKLIREKGIDDFFIEEMKKGYPQQDQDVLNYCCYDHISFLPLKYCMLSRWTDNNGIYGFKKQVYTESEIAEAKETPAIIHYAGAIAKPWINVRAAYANEWWDLAKRILTDEEYAVWYNRAEEWNKSLDYSSILKTIKSATDSVYIFGYTYIGKILCDRLMAQGKRVIAFVDNNKNKIGQDYKGIAVISADSIESDCKADIIISSQNAFELIKNQLLSQGITEDCIIQYKHKIRFYYECLDRDFYEFEYRDSLAYFIGEKAWNMKLEELRQIDEFDVYNQVYGGE